ncbi:MAG: 3-deoxy-7-phosphoheptulonate synthase [Planctomycetota bacterium]|jgi:3-deoxy-7-phosphoheptulonate synthase
MHFQTDDLRIEGLRPLLPPAILMEELPLSDEGAETVARGREAISQVLAGNDKRLLVVVGPCSIHDPKAGIEYADRLAIAAKEHAKDLLIVMRVYFEKPRTIVGWKGLINDPNLDGSFAINEGLRAARKFLLDVTERKLPIGSEFLDPIMPQFLADVISWGAIGARTSESQVHRELASGLSMPVGIKNGTNGKVQIAIDAIRSCAHPHHFLSVTKQGVAAIVATRGNNECHIILRGGSAGPNYCAGDVEEVRGALEKAGLAPRIMIDCSHANSGKDHVKQADVADEVADQIAGGNSPVRGVMLESFLEDGNQKHPSDKPLEYGKSITDACMSWERTLPVLTRLAGAARAR